MQQTVIMPHEAINRGKHLAHPALLQRTWNSCSDLSWYALATARMASTSLPVYLRPALLLMMAGTSSAALSITLHSSMYLSTVTAVGSSSVLNCSKASKK